MTKAIPRSNRNVGFSQTADPDISAAGPVHGAGLPNPIQHHLRRISNSYAMFRLLEALAASAEPIRPTRLQCACHTNYSRFEIYVDRLSNGGLIEVRIDDTTRKKAVTLTPKGRTVLASGEVWFSALDSMENLL